MIFPRRLSRSQISLLYQNIPLPNGATSCSQLASRAYPPAFYPFPGSGFGPFTSGTSGSTYCNFNSTAVAPLPYAMPYGIGLAPMFYYTFDGTLADSVGGTSITLPAQSITVGTSYTTGVSGQALVIPAATSSSNDYYLQLPFLTNAIYQASWSFCLWVFYTSASCLDTCDFPILEYGERNTDTGLQCVVEDGYPYFGFWADDLSQTGGRFGIATWGHVCYVKTTGSRTTQTIYFNGEYVASRTANANINGGSATNTAIAGGNVLGQGWWLQDASLDEMTFFPRALNASEVAYLMMGSHY